MTNVTCIEKIRGKGNIIVAYRLKDTSGNIIKAQAYAIKDLIKKGAISVNNLTLTSDNRLVDCKRKKSNSNTALLIPKVAQAIVFMQKAVLGMGDSYYELVEEICTEAGIQMNNVDPDELEKYHFEAYNKLLKSPETAGNTITNFIEYYYEDDIDTLLRDTGYYESNSKSRGKLTEYFKVLNAFMTILLRNERIDDDTYNSFREMEEDFKSLDLDICALGYAIGNSYYNHLDDRYFLRSNDVYTIGKVQLPYDRERQFGSYVVHASYRGSKLSNNIVIAAGLSRDKKTNNVVVQFVHIKREEGGNDKYTVIKKAETNKWDYKDIGKAIAVTMNKIADQDANK